MRLASILLKTPLRFGTKRGDGKALRAAHCERPNGWPGRRDFLNFGKSRTNCPSPRRGNQTEVTMQLIGCGTALVTPFRTDLSRDEVTLRKLVLRQIRAGVYFL